MPVAMPTWRKVELMPDAMPLRAGWTTAIAVEASGGLTMPMPMPATTNPASSVVHSESSVTPCMSVRPTPTQASPTPRKPRAGNRSDRRPAIGETKNETA